MKYLILSLKWSKPGEAHLTWYRPNCKGYTVFLEDAGHYTRKEIESHPEYYNNGVDTLAIPVATAKRLSRQIVVPANLDFCRAEALAAPAPARRDGEGANQ